MTSGPPKVSTATVRVPAAEAVTATSTRVPSWRTSSKAPGANVTPPRTVTVTDVTADRWAAPSLTTTLSTPGAGGSATTVTARSRLRPAPVWSSQVTRTV